MIYVFLADGFEENEALLPVDIWRRAGLSVKTVSVASRQVTGSHGIPVVADALFDEIDPMAADVYVLPGGLPGTTHLAEHEPLNRTLRRAAQAGKTMAAICAAPGVFGKLGLLDGRAYTCFPGCEAADYRGRYTANGVQVDNGGTYLLITGKGAGQAAAFAFALLAEQGLEEKAEELRRSMQFSPEEA